MADQTIKAQVQALVQAGLDEQRAFVAGLTGEQRNELGTAEHWAAKNIVAHVAAGNAELAAAVQAALRGEAPDAVFIPSDFNQRNRDTFEERRDWSWSKVTAAAEDAYADLMAALKHFSDSELTPPDHFPKPLSRPLWRTFVGYAYWHPVTHFTDFYVEQGDMLRATRLQETMARETNRLPLDEARGIADYNLACFYAKNGQKRQALDLLPGALKLAPSLLDLSKQDSDLDSLHGEPDYQALYA